MLWFYLGLLISANLGSKINIPPSTIDSIIKRPLLRRTHRQYDQLNNFLHKERDSLLKPLKKMETLLSKHVVHTEHSSSVAASEQEGPVHASHANILLHYTAQPPAPPAPPALPAPPTLPTSLLTSLTPPLTLPPSPPPLPPPTAPSFPIGKTALVVICYNRPQYLKRTLNSVLKHYHTGIDLFVSQDGRHAGVANAITDFISEAKGQHQIVVEHLQHTNNRQGRNGYEKLAIHFGWILQNLFNQRKYTRVILLEDDMEIAPDFFDYFLTLAPLYDQDETIMAISAFNDNGFKGYVSDAKAVVRSDYFPGLGWMINDRMWQEWGPKWPKGYWDDWLREPPQRKGRVTLRPEISRSFTFGRRGVSVGQFYDKFLGRIQLNDQKVEWNAVQGLDILTNKQAYDQRRKEDLDAAMLINLSVAKRLVADISFSQQYESQVQDFKIEYKSLERGGSPSFMTLAKQLKIMDSIKANVPRTAYMETMYIRLGGTQRRLFITRG